MRRKKAGVRWTTDPPNAGMDLWRVNWADTSQRVLMRHRAVGQIRRGWTAFVAEVRRLAHALGQTVGRTFQASCDVALKTRGKWRTVELLACPVTWRPHPEQIASARRGYEDWWLALCHIPAGKMAVS